MNSNEGKLIYHIKLHKKRSWADINSTNSNSILMEPLFPYIAG